MDADEIEALGPALDAYLAEFDDCFGRAEPRAHLRTYVRGQRSGLPRKGVEPIAWAAGVVPGTLQQFLSDAKWGAGRMGDRLQQGVARDHADPLAVGLIDETSHPKKGGHTPGVQRPFDFAQGGAGRAARSTTAASRSAYATPRRAGSTRCATASCSYRRNGRPTGTGAGRPGSPTAWSTGPSGRSSRGCWTGRGRTAWPCRG